MEYEGDGDTNRFARNDSQMFGKKTWKLEIEIGQNTEASPGDLRRFAVDQTPVENHLLTLAWKTRKK